MARKQRTIPADSIRNVSPTLTQVGKKWRATLSYYVEDSAEGGRKREQISRTFQREEARTKGEARAMALEWHRKLVADAEEAEILADPSRKRWTVAEWADKTIADSTAGPSTKRGYRAHLRRIRETFGSVPLEELTADDVGKWQDSLARDGLSSNTVNHAHALLNQVMGRALEEGLVARNVCKMRGAKAPSVPHREHNTLTADEYGRLLDYLEREPDSHIVLAALIGIHTGMRRGEICGLRWRDVDLDAQTVRVTNVIAISEDAGMYEKEPKTRASIRTIPIPRQLAERLRKHRGNMWQEIIALTRTTAEQFGNLFVLGEIDGSYYSPDTLSHQWGRLAKRLGLMGTLRPPVFHDLRHTFATRLLIEGADVKTVSSLLGHSSVAHTLNMYAAADPNAQRAAANTLEAMAERERAAAARRREAEEAARGQLLEFPTGTEG